VPGWPSRPRADGTDWGTRAFGPSAGWPGGWATVAADLTERLSANRGQRLGAIDLVTTMGLEPVALTQASAMIASSAMSCRNYRGA
jgi:hypothetical protein